MKIKKFSVDREVTAMGKKYLVLRKETKNKEINIFFLPKALTVEIFINEKTLAGTKFYFKVLPVNFFNKLFFRNRKKLFCQD